MKKIYFTFVMALAFIVIAHAQKGNFGNVNYTIPPGYELIKNDNVLSYYKMDAASGAYCRLMIYAVLPGQGTPLQNFDFFWNNMLKKSMNVTGTPTMQPAATLKGWQLSMGTSLYKDNGANTMAILSTFSGENKMQNVCILTNAESYQSDIESFIASVDVKKDISGTSTSQNSSTNNAAVQNASKSSYNLWMAYKLSLGGNLADMSFQYVVLSSDNRCLLYFPEKGLNNLEQDFPASSSSWGKVTDQGSKLVLNNDKYGKMELYKKAATAMSRYADSKPGSYYKKCKPVNGIRIEGAYSPDVSLYKNQSTIVDKIMDNPNKRPIIFFKKDGTYINEGLSFSNLTFGDDFAIGNGTYELKDFSLILTTSSGQKLQMNFAGILDANPSAGADGYIINNKLFYKLNKSYQAH